VRRLLLLMTVLCAAPLWPQTIAVLPLANLSGSPNLDWVGESVSETIREALAMERLLVLDRESGQEAYRRLSLRPYAQLTLASVVRLGDTLDAERVVYGWFETGDQQEGAADGDTFLSLTVRVLDLAGLRLSEAVTAAGRLQDLDEIQNDAAWQTLRLLLGAAAAPAEERWKAGRRRVRLDALENYVRALLATSSEQKHRLLTQAARLDEGFIPPRFELGRLFMAEKNYRVAAGWLEQVTPDSPYFAEASFLLGLCRCGMGEYEKAESSFRMVAAIVPLNEVWNNLGAAQLHRSPAEAVESIRKALEGDPNDPDYRFNLGYALWKAGEFDKAADAFRSTLDLTPEDPEAILMLGRCLKKTAPQSAEMMIEGLERIKTNFEGLAYRQLQAALDVKAN